MYAYAEDRHAPSIISFSMVKAIPVHFKRISAVFMFLVKERGSNTNILLSKRYTSDLHIHNILPIEF